MARPVTLTRLDPRYPSRLVSLPGAPASICWQGGPLEADLAIAIVGAREATEESVAFTSEITAGLVAANAVIVSGGAVGVDAAAHVAALRSGGRTWAVAGTDARRCYPASHADLFKSIARGPSAMVWPFTGRGARGAFLARNHVLVALADAVVVVQAGLDSGALHAATCARRLGKPLWVVPAAPWMSPFAGSLKLLEGGARVLTSLESLLGSLNPPARLATRPGPPGPGEGESGNAISRCEYEVLYSLSDKPLHVDAIVALAGQSTQAVSAALLTLALENVVVEGPPGSFRRRRAL